jgi:ribonuclease P protein component
MRVGIVVPRLGQSAVARNKVKRRLREIVRTALLPLPCSYDLVIRARGAAYRRDFEALGKEIRQLADQLAQLQDRGRQ